MKKCTPVAKSQHAKIRELLDLYDSDADDTLTLNEFAFLLRKIRNKITTLPAVRPFPFSCI